MTDPLERVDVSTPQYVADRLANSQQRLPLGTLLLMMDTGTVEHERRIDEELSRMLQEGNGGQA